MLKISLIVLALFGLLVLLSYSGGNDYPDSDHNRNGRFHNEEVDYHVFDFRKLYAITKAYFNGKSEEASPLTHIPVVQLTAEDVKAMPDYSVVRLTHSTLLFKLGGEYFLTDPMFSERVSAVSFIGTKRFHPSPITIAELPPIKAVLMSHDHYDHLDTASIEEIKDKVGHFYAPLGVGKRLIAMGVDKGKVSELDWWQSLSVGEVELTATPAQHFSGRGLFDGNETLWTSWVIKTPAVKLFFGGDSGYFGGFKRIGEKFGPFDMTFVEAGAYHELWREIHMFPQESVQAHLDLKGKVMVPIHNGSFDLALHSWKEPFEQTAKFAVRQQVAIRFPRMGEVLSLQNPKPTPHWW